MPGRFVTFEGIEGVGKSTQVALAASHLRTRDIDVVITREPGGTPVAESIRRLVLEPQQDVIDGVSELLLMFAARSVHLSNLIEPALARGAWVLCDRFTDATEAYQGGGRGIAVEHVRSLERIAQRGRRPDLTLLLDLPVELAMQRSRARRAPDDRFEAEQPGFFKRVREAYLAIHAREPQRVVLIDASGPVHGVAAAIARVLDALDGAAV
jgi:dTMP kinase